MEKYTVKIPIIRKNFDKTQSAKFKGNLYIVSNKYGVIYDWKIIFNYIDLDLLTTNSWIAKNSSNFRIRKLLFSELGLKQSPRPSRTSNNIFNLNAKKLKTLNSFFNDRNKYGSTIKNIVTILKGSTPTGEASKPKQAEMVMDTNSSIENFVILIDDLVMKQKVAYDSVAIGAEKIDISDFIKLNKSIESAFKYMQQEKDLVSWANYLANIKNYYNLYNEDLNTANNIAKKSRKIFEKNIDMKIDKFPFDFKSKDEFIKCHIYEVHDIRDAIIEAIRTKKEFKKYIKMIEDVNNFIPLPGEIHRKFDANYFTYKNNGEIYVINEKGNAFKNEFMNEKFYVIPKYFLNDNRKKYLTLRNKNINNFSPQSY